jgi:hypothetical protein
MRTLPFTLALVLCGPAALAGDSAGVIAPVQPVVQSNRKNPALHGPNEFSFWAAGTTNAPHVIALSSDRRVSMLGLRYGRRIFHTRLLAFTWTADFDPVVLVSQPRNVKGANIGGREWIYGAGFSPFGVRFDVLPRRRLQPFVNASGGAVLFTRPAPYSDATRFNYMFEAGFGVRYFARRGSAFTFGWKLNHISNNYRVPDNPGIDSSMIYTGISFFK